MLLMIQDSKDVSICQVRDSSALLVLYFTLSNVSLFGSVLGRQSKAIDDLGSNIR